MMSTVTTVTLNISCIVVVDELFLLNLHFSCTYYCVNKAPSLVRCIAKYQALEGCILPPSIIFPFSIHLKSDLPTVRSAEARGVADRIYPLYGVQRPEALPAPDATTSPIIKPYKPSASAKIKIKIIPTNNRVW